jgi:hypothetical protein
MPPTSSTWAAGWHGLRLIRGGCVLLRVRQGSGPSGGSNVRGSAVLPVDPLVANARQFAPTLRMTQMYMPGGYYEPVAVFHRKDEPVLVRDRANVVMLDAINGAPLLVRPATTLGWPARWVDMADPLHFGNFAGLGRCSRLHLGVDRRGCACSGCGDPRRVAHRAREVATSRRPCPIGLSIQAVALAGGWPNTASSTLCGALGCSNPCQC